MKINEKDPALVEEVNRMLDENEQEYGKRFCCGISPVHYNDENCDDYICPCKNFRENTPVGELCSCGLYEKEEDD